MKKSFMTRVLATGLSFAMAFSMAAATNVTTASAAAKEASVTSMMKVASKTVTEGKSVTTYMNSKALKSYRINKVSLTDTAKKYIAVTLKSSRKGFTIKANADAVTNAKLEKKGVNVKIYFSKATTAAKAKKTAASKYANLKVVVKAKEEAPKPVVAKLTGATQKEATKIAVTFDNAVITPGAISSFKVVRTDGSIVVPIKTVIYDADKKGATLETYVGMTDAKEYTVTYTDADEAKTVSTATFTATDNKIADLQVSTTSLVAKETTPVEIKTLDAQGVLLNKYSLTKAEQNKITFDLKSSDGTAYRAGDGIYVAKVGDTVTLTATLHTYKYVDGKEQDTIERVFNLVGTTEDYAAISFGYSIAAKKPDFNAASYKQNKAIAKGATSKFFANFKKGTKDVESKFAIESSDPSVLLVEDKAVGQLTKTGVTVKGVKEGTAFILVKDADKALVASLEVNVGAASAANTITLSANSVITSDTGAETKTVNVNVKDQYGNTLNLTDLKVECTDATAKSAASITTVTTPTGDKGVITVDGSQAKANKNISYSYKVTAKTAVGTKEAYLNVTINHAGGVADITNYGLVLSSEDVDLAWTKASTNTGSALTIKVAAYDKDGGLVTFLPLADSGVAITVKKTTDATKTLAVESGAASYTKVDTAAAVILSATSKGAVTSISDPVKKIAEVGTYTVTATFDVAGKTNTFSKQFNVKDTQGTFTFKVADTSKDKWKGDPGTTLTPASDGNVTYYINGTTIDNANVKIEEVKYDTISGTGKYTVSKVVIAYKVDDRTSLEWVYATAVPTDGANSVVIYEK